MDMKPLAKFTAVVMWICVIVVLLIGIAIGRLLL